MTLNKKIKIFSFLLLPPTIIYYSSGFQTQQFGERRENCVQQTYKHTYTCSDLFSHFILVLFHHYKFDRQAHKMKKLCITLLPNRNKMWKFVSFEKSFSSFFMPPFHVTKHSKKIKWGAFWCRKYKKRKKREKILMGVFFLS